MNESEFVDRLDRGCGLGDVKLGHFFAKYVLFHQQRHQITYVSQGNHKGQGDFEHPEVRYSEQRTIFGTEKKSCTSWQKFHHEVQIHRILEGEKHFHHPSAKKKIFLLKKKFSRWKKSTKVWTGFGSAYWWSASTRTSRSARTCATCINHLKKKQYFECKYWRSSLNQETKFEPGSSLVIPVLVPPCLLSSKLSWQKCVPYPVSVQVEPAMKNTCQIKYIDRKKNGGILQSGFVRTSPNAPFPMTLIGSKSSTPKRDRLSRRYSVSFVACWVLFSIFWKQKQSSESQEFKEKTKELNVWN